MVVLLLCTLFGLNKIGDTLDDTKIIGYFKPTVDGMNIGDLDASKITHLLYAFATFHLDGTATFNGPGENRDWEDFHLRKSVTPYDDECPCGDVCLKGYVHQLYRKKRDNPHMRTVLSIGGWNWSGNISAVLKDPVKRKRAVETSTDLMTKYAFDGVDLDWEFPTNSYRQEEEKEYTTDPKDFENLLSYLQEMRQYFDKLNLPKDTILSTAMPALLDEFPSAKDLLSKFSQVCSFVIIMSYEYHHNKEIAKLGAPLFAASQDSDDEKKQTVAIGMSQYSAIDKNKLIMGIPLYGTGFDDVKGNTGGRDMKCLGSELEKPTIMKPINYRQVLALADSKEYGGYDYSDERAQASICNNKKFISFDSVESVAKKAKYVKSQGFGGIMMWDLSQDVLEKDNADRSLLKSLYDNLDVDIKKDRSYEDMCLSESEFCNLKCDYTNIRAKEDYARSNGVVFSMLWSILFVYFQ